MIRKITALLTALTISAASGYTAYASKLETKIIDMIRTEQQDTAASDNAEDHKTITIDGKKYTLTFEDDFDGNKLDPKKWERCNEEKRHDLNNYWDDSMSYLDGKGNLIIGMSYDEKRDAFLSGAIQSKRKFEQTYGYYEIRCAVNTVPGYWTAFWMYNDKVVNTGDGGLDGTEIDIFESPYCEQKQIQHTLHWNGYDIYHGSDGSISDADVYDGEYHTFSLLWTKDEYVFYIDGKESWRTNAKDARGTCRNPLYMIISAETGSWTGVPDTEALPDLMKVDYVRVYSAVK